MKKAFFSILFLVAASLAIAQPYDPSKINKKAIQLYEQALERAQDGNLTHAAGLLLQSIESDKKYVDAYLSLAGVYGQLKSHTSSIKYYELAFALDSNYTAEYNLPYSINLAATGEFEKALYAVEKVLAKNPPQTSATYKAAMYRKSTYTFAVEWAGKNAGKNYVFAPRNLGGAINTPESEYFPSLTIGDGELVFTRRINNFNEDFYSSKRSNESWEPASPIPGKVNTPQNEGAQNISPDGQWLVFTGCNRPDGFGSCDIYISYNTPEGWSEPVNLGNRVNSSDWESQPCLSPDKRELYFASRRPGGYGGSDLYVSHLLPNGKWSEPENMGAGINTSGEESSPFIHADNQTLYFNSNGHPGYGGNDLYYVRKGPGGDWSQPINLGYPINTIHDEGTIFIGANGKTAYYASDRSDSKGGLDIYSFELREDVRPYQTLWVKGKVFDSKISKGIPSTVELIDIASGQLISKLQTDETGNYLITLPLGKDYVFNVNRKGYLFYSDNFMSNRVADSIYVKDIPLQPIEANASIILKNVFFETNSAEISPSSAVELDMVVALLKENPDVKIEISGHTDNVGKPADNLVLSNNRAKAVTTYLSSKGISPLRLFSKGYGETRPVSDNSTDSGRAANRRTEMKVVGK